MNIDYSKTNDYLIGIDSDGCAFDTMELKHKECFIPNIIHHWGLKGVSKYAREAAEFVNLYSKTRGVNRFPALIEVFRLLNKRPEVVARGVKIEIPQVLVDWIGQESKLGNPALTKYVEQTHDPLMEKALRWSIEVNETIDKVVGEGVPPFPKVRESLQKVQGKADVLVVSQTPQAALNKESARKKNASNSRKSIRRIIRSWSATRPAITTRRSPTARSSSRSIRAKRKRAGSGSTPRASTNSSTERSPANTRRSFSRNSIPTCPSCPLGNSLINAIYGSHGSAARPRKESFV